MSMPSEDLREFTERARVAAELAAAHIRSSRPNELAKKTGGDTAASQIVTDVDIAAQTMILDALSPSIKRLNLAVLSEEQPDDRTRLTADYFVSVDPLDGTLPFVEGNPGFAVSIALVARDGTPWAGVVVNPETETTYVAMRGQGLTRNGASWHPTTRDTGETLNVFVDRSFAKRHHAQKIRAALKTLAAELSMGSPKIHDGAGAVVNACCVLENAPACYFKFPKTHEGGGSLWDFAATACLFHEANAVATDMRGQSLELNRRESTFMNHRGVLFATSESLASGLRSLWLREVAGQM